MNWKVDNIDFSQLHILVIGDIMLDEFIYGHSTRLSPEFNAPVINVTNKEVSLGGAGNVAANLIGLGAEVSLVSIVGKDHPGKEIFHLLDCINCQNEYIYQLTDRATTVKTRVFSDNIPIARIDTEITEEIENDLVNRIITKVESIIKSKSIDGIIFQDYNKGLLSEKLIQELLTISNKAKIKTFVDPKFKHIQAYSGCNYFKPNLSELSFILQYTPDIILEELDDAAKKLKQYVEHDTLILTLSEKGAYFSDGYKSDIISTSPMMEADVSGAGDSFISAFCLAICSGIKIDDGLRFANAVSRLACSKKGVQAVLITDLVQT